MKIILASNSPRRKELLSQVGILFEIISSKFEEHYVEMHPTKLVEHFAYMKAKDVADRLQEDALVIGADTIVCLGGPDGELPATTRLLPMELPMGKPKDEADAFEMLGRLSGKQHLVMSGLSIINTATGESITEHEVTKVKMKELKSSEIAAYISTGEPMDKAGAYAIQGMGSLFVEGIEGDYFNVVGLPLFRLGKMLGHFGVKLL